MRNHTIVNKRGSSETWAADVIAGGRFALRVSVRTKDGVKTVRIRRIDDQGRTGKLIAVRSSEKGRPLGMDAIEDLIEGELDA